MLNLPIYEIVDRLCEDATDEFGWLSDGLYKTAVPHSERGTVYVDRPGNINLYALMGIIEQTVNEMEEDK
ncbi:hypothetical protein [Bifidobacterium adolescentis]|uniref:hypothetical protein n=1 Tax=Bifidobacterium adolescentis TaxID=1680 RepID=UPI003BB5AFD2